MSGGTRCSRPDAAAAGGECHAGEIADTAHPLFAGLEAATLAGAQMFDSVAEADEQWQVLAATRGRPAILELPPPGPWRC